MSNDRVGKALERVAAECVDEVMEAVGLGNDTNDACALVLEERLGPLLRAGQAMRDGVIGGSGGLKRIQLAREYDAAFAALERET